MWPRRSRIDVRTGSRSLLLQRLIGSDEDPQWVLANGAKEIGAALDPTPPKRQNMANTLLTSSVPSVLKPDLARKTTHRTDEVPLCV